MLFLVMKGGALNSNVSSVITGKQLKVQKYILVVEGLSAYWHAMWENDCSRWLMNLLENFRFESCRWCYIGNRCFSSVWRTRWWLHLTPPVNMTTLRKERKKQTGKDKWRKWKWFLNTLAADWSLGNSLILQTF